MANTRFGFHSGKVHAKEVRIENNGKLKLANASGTASLVAGTVVVSSAAIDSTDSVELCHLAAAGTVGILTAAVSDGSITITSKNPVGGATQTADANSISWAVFGNL